jgi:hypothetical protein
MSEYKNVMYMSKHRTVIGEPIYYNNKEEHICFYKYKIIISSNVHPMFILRDISLLNSLVKCIFFTRDKNFHKNTKPLAILMSEIL